MIALKQLNYFFKKALLYIYCFNCINYTLGFCYKKNQISVTVCHLKCLYHWNKIIEKGDGRSIMNIKRILSVVSFALTMMIVLSITTVSASPMYTQGAKTPPPTQEFQIQGTFNPNHIYLQDGTNQISKSTINQVKLTATTYAYQVVNSIGITFYLQKWSGSSWADVGPGTSLSATNKSSYTNNVYGNVESGYYYRARTVHWVSNGSTYEQGELLSGSMLMN
jgi:hypothetical protein